ncbi:channel accessory protein ArfB [Mycobacterium simiae]|uniref:channel accessory protein ArfB n=1 Tax=Mycobacterium simiae TaxID=1784 RepID=UPI00165EF68D|nr:hypothetical protein [Mycobacterium simiae]
MDFIIQWLYYLVAFAAGSAVSWAVATVFFQRRGAEAKKDAADASQETGTAP